MKTRCQLEAAAGPLIYGYIETPFRVELTHARFSQQQFAPHAHEGWSLCAVIAGRKNIALQTKPQQLAQAGDIYLLHPEQAHAGGSVDDQPCEYVMLHIPDDEWQAQCLRRGLPLHRRGVAPRPDGALCRRISAFVLRVLAHQDQRLDWSEEWRRLSDFIFEENKLCGEAGPDAASDGRLRAAREHLRTHWNKPVPLEALGSLSTLSKFELTRRFCAAYGLPPHRYQMTLRIIEAKDLLMAGRPIAEVATATGFSDQSHLGRVFKSVLGLTPGALSHQIGRHRVTADQ